MIRSTSSEWLVGTPSRDASLSLVAVPYAGGGAQAFRGWQELLPPDIAVLAARLPGRESRFRESAATTMDDLVPPLAEALGPITETPYALFGHSMGALIAYELARRLQADGAPPPLALVVSGCGAPQLPRIGGPFASLPDDQLLGRLTELGGLTPDQLEERELLEVMLPTLRADLMVVEHYEARPGPPLRCPVVVSIGTADRETGDGRGAAWSQVTTGECSVVRFPGGHFYYLDRLSEFVQAIGLRVLRYASTSDRLGKVGA